MKTNHPKMNTKNETHDSRAKAVGQIVGASPLGTVVRNLQDTLEEVAGLPSSWEWEIERSHSGIAAHAFKSFSMNGVTEPGGDMRWSLSGTQEDTSDLLGRLVSKPIGNLDIATNGDKNKATAAGLVIQQFIEGLNSRVMELHSYNSTPIGPRALAGLRAAASEPAAAKIYRGPGDPKSFGWTMADKSIASVAQSLAARIEEVTGAKVTANTNSAVAQRLAVELEDYRFTHSNTYDTFNAYAKSSPADVRMLWTLTVTPSHTSKAVEQRQEAGEIVGKFMSGLQIGTSQLRAEIANDGDSHPLYREIQDRIEPSAPKAQAPVLKPFMLAQDVCDKIAEHAKTLRNGTAREAQYAFQGLLFFVAGQDTGLADAMRKAMDDYASKPGEYVGSQGLIQAKKMAHSDHIAALRAAIESPDFLEARLKYRSSDKTIVAIHHCDAASPSGSTEVMNGHEADIRPLLLEIRGTTL